MNKENFLQIEHGMMLYNVNTGDVYQVKTPINKALFKDDVIADTPDGEKIAEIELMNIANGSTDKVRWTLDFKYEHLLESFNHVTDPHVKAYLSYIGMAINNVHAGLQQALSSKQNTGFKL